jgi:hypothetical protein
MSNYPKNLLFVLFTLLGILTLILAWEFVDQQQHYKAIIKSRNERIEDLELNIKLISHSDYGWKEFHDTIYLPKGDSGHVSGRWLKPIYFKPLSTRPFDSLMTIKDNHGNIIITIK